MFWTWIDRRIFATHYCTYANLRVFRVIFALAMLTLYVQRYYFTLSADHLFWSPPLSLAAFFVEPPPNWVIVLLLAGTAASCLWLAWGVRAVAASFTFAIGLLLLQTIAYGYGKIDHAHLLFVTPLVLSTAWGKDEDGVATWQVSLLAMLIALMMFHAGFVKAATGWIYPSNQATFGALWLYVYGLDKNLPIGQWALENLPLWTWKSMDYVTVVFECGGVFAWLNRRAFRYWLVAATAFHLGVDVMFNIFFIANMLVYAAFLSWPYAPKSLRSERVELPLPGENVA